MGGRNIQVIFFSVNTQTHTYISQEAESSKVTGNLAEDKQALKTARANLCDKGLDGSPSCPLKHQHLQYLPVLGIGYSPTLNERAPFPWQAEGRGPQDAKESSLALTNHKTSLYLNATKAPSAPRSHRLLNFPGSLVTRGYCRGQGHRENNIQAWQWVVRGKRLKQNLVRPSLSRPT